MINLDSIIIFFNHIDEVGIAVPSECYLTLTYNRADVSVVKMDGSTDNFYSKFIVVIELVF